MTDINEPADFRTAGDPPPEAVHFLETVPLFGMLEFSAFPDTRWAPGDWQKMQDYFLQADLDSTSLRALIGMPDDEMLVFDLAQRDEGYPLGIAPAGFADEADPLGLTLAEYLALAHELAPLEARMQQGDYPYDEIVAVYDARGLRDNEYWGSLVEELEEDRDSTESRMQHIRETSGS